MSVILFIHSVIYVFNQVRQFTFRHCRHKKHLLVSVLLGMCKGIFNFFLRWSYKKKIRKHWVEDKTWRFPVIVLSIYIYLNIKNCINRVLAIIHFYITTFILLFTGCNIKSDCHGGCSSHGQEKHCVDNSCLCLSH